eukprot:TRINITY_DN2370_c0_g1_i1.p3 TRINITY_DN2370_c0_g1~~TRINITY_DN2370_c0_g1_i1.p3  ORF type:complete len:92 (+),score=34.24 TRINITY_DN2370_c0_g1_i1:1053-1328(+)
MRLFNILNIPGHIFNLAQKNTFGSDKLDKTCGVDVDWTSGLAYNGSTLARYDFRVKDGKCYLEERVHDYQTKKKKYRLRGRSSETAKAHRG